MALKHAVTPVWGALTYVAGRLRRFVSCLFAVVVWCTRKVHGSFWNPCVALIQMVLGSVMNGVVLYVVLKKLVMESGYSLAEQ